MSAAVFAVALADGLALAGLAVALWRTWGRL